MTTHTARTAARSAAVIAAAIGLSVAVPGAAQAKEKTDVDVRGYALATAPSGGVYAFSGYTTAADGPFVGTTFSGTVGVADGTLPQSHACEPGTGSLTLTNASGSVTLAVDAEICEHSGTYPTNGSWTVTSSSGSFAKAKGSGLFFWNTQWWGTTWSALGTFKN